MKKGIIIAVAVVIAMFAAIPFIKTDSGSEIRYASYKDDTAKYETGISGKDDGFFYWPEKDITITDVQKQKVLFLYLIKVTYEKGNLCASEYELEESFMEHFFESAEVTEESMSSKELKALIDGRKAVTGSTRYPWPAEEPEMIEYTLDGEYGCMFVYEYEDKVIIQVGLSDEGPEYIAYE